MQIREATSADEAELRRLVREFFQWHIDLYGERAEFIKPKSSSAFDNDITTLVQKILTKYPHGKVFVAEQDHHLVGYVDVCWKEWFLRSTLPKMGSIDMMYVQEPYRSQGWGKKLLETATMWLKSQGVQAANLEVAEMNEQAIKFYQREGYKTYNVVMRRKLD